LDYWYDEGPQDGSGGNSHNYPERMMRIRKGNLEEEIIDDAHTAEMPVIQKTQTLNSSKGLDIQHGSQQKLPTPSTSSSI
jgi:hypothetical protein